MVDIKERERGGRERGREREGEREREREGRENLSFLHNLYDNKSQKCE